jgi:hypothetical protein
MEECMNSMLAAPSRASTPIMASTMYTIFAAVESITISPPKNLYSYGSQFLEEFEANINDREIA